MSSTGARISIAGMDNFSERLQLDRLTFRKVTGFLFGNWASRIYLGLFAVSVLLAAYWIITGDSSAEFNFGALLPYLLAAPGSLLLLVPATQTGSVAAVSIGFFAAPVIGVLLNTAAISTIVHLLRRPKPRAPQGTTLYTESRPDQEILPV